MSETDGQQIAFGDALDPFPAWVSLERELGIRVSGWSMNRGRVDESQRTGTGTAQIHVNDLSGYLGSGGEFPTQVRLLLRGSPRFRGYVDSIDIEVNHNRPSLSHATISCVDMFDHLSTVELVPGIHGHYPVPLGQEQYVYYRVDQVDDRIIDVLTDAGIPAAQRSVFSGNVMLHDVTHTSGTTAMQVLDEAIDSEWPGVSNRFIDSTGRYCFRGRHARFNPENPTYGIQFWEAATEGDVTTGRAQIRRLSYSRSRKLVVNSAIAYPEGIEEAGIPEVYIDDATSKALYGLRSWSAENLLTRRHLSNGNSGVQEAILFATYQVANYKAVEARITRVQFRALRDFDDRAAAIWDLMQNVEIGDVLDIFTAAISGRYFVEGIGMEVRELNGEIPMVVCDLDLSPAAFWTVDPF
jgi:hypothetical protein